MIFSGSSGGNKSSSSDPVILSQGSFHWITLTFAWFFLSFFSLSSLWAVFERLLWAPIISMSDRMSKDWAPSSSDFVSRYMPEKRKVQEVERRSIRRKEVADYFDKKDRKSNKQISTGFAWQMMKRTSSSEKRKFEETNKHSLCSSLFVLDLLSNNSWSGSFGKWCGMTSFNIANSQTPVSSQVIKECRMWDKINRRSSNIAMRC